MKILISRLAAVMAVVLMAGCSGSTPGSMTQSKPRSASEDPTMDPWERVGAQMKDKQSAAPPVVTPATAAVAAPAIAAPQTASPTPKAAQ